MDQISKNEFDSLAFIDGSLFGASQYFIMGYSYSNPKSSSNGYCVFIPINVSDSIEISW